MEAMPLTATEKAAFFQHNAEKLFNLRGTT
jgi:hypothetical protein